MPSRASIGKHPIHPMLIPFPVGLLIFSFVMDVCNVWTEQDFPYSIVAYYTMWGGVIGALLAAVPGLIDYLTIRAFEIKRLANMHLVLNVTIVGLYIYNIYLRTTTDKEIRRKYEITPLFLSLIGSTLVAISAYIAQEMVYVHGMGVEKSALGEKKEDIKGEKSQEKGPARVIPVQ